MEHPLLSRHGPGGTRQTPVEAQPPPSGLGRLVRQAEPIALLIAVCLCIGVIAFGHFFTESRDILEAFAQHDTLKLVFALSLFTVALMAILIVRQLHSEQRQIDVASRSEEMNMASLDHIDKQVGIVGSDVRHVRNDLVAAKERIQIVGQNLEAFATRQDNVRQSDSVQIDGVRRDMAQMDADIQSVNSVVEAVDGDLNSLQMQVRELAHQINKDREHRESDLHKSSEVTKRNFDEVLHELKELREQIERLNASQHRSFKGVVNHLRSSTRAKDSGQEPIRIAQELGSTSGGLDGSDTLIDNSDAHSGEHPDSALPN